MRQSIFILLLWVIPSLSFAQGSNAGFGYLNVPMSARAAAMGGSYFAVKDGDVHLAQFNPALLDSSMHRKIGLGYVDYFDGIGMGFAAYAHRLNKKMTGQAAIQYCNYGNQTELDGLGYELGQFQAADYALILGAGYQYDSLWSIGLQWKTFYSVLANYQSLGIALDGGVSYHNPKKNFSASLVFSNAGLQLTSYSNSTREKLPFNLQFGLVKKPIHAPFRFSLVYSNMQRWNLVWTNPNAAVITDPITGEIINDNTWKFGDQLMRHVTFGSEFILSKNFHLRLAYNYRRRQELKLEDRPGTAGFSYGFGFRINKFQISYGRATFHMAGPSNQLSITTDLNQW
ncbi:MAG: type IX secretion system protein PorQ [Flavobacteriales bacterium]